MHPPHSLLPFNRTIAACPPTGHAVVVFDEVAFAARALELIRQLARSVGDSPPTSCKLLHFNVIESATAAAGKAGEDALRADVLAISAASLRSLSPELRVWIDAWASAKGSRPASLLLVELDAKPDHGHLFEAAKLAAAVCHGDIRCFTADAQDRIIPLSLPAGLDHRRRRALRPAETESYRNRSVSLSSLAA